MAVDDTSSTTQNTGSAIAVANAIKSSSDATGVTARANETGDGAEIQGGALDPTIAFNQWVYHRDRGRSGDAGDAR